MMNDDNQHGRDDLKHVQITKPPFAHLSDLNGIAPFETFPSMVSAACVGLQFDPARITPDGKSIQITYQDWIGALKVQRPRFLYDDAAKWMEDHPYLEGDISTPLENVKILGTGRTLDESQRCYWFSTPCNVVVCEEGFTFPADRVLDVEIYGHVFKNHVPANVCWKCRERNLRRIVSYLLSGKVFSLNDNLTLQISDEDIPAFNWRQLWNNRPHSTARDEAVEFGEVLDLVIVGIMSGRQQGNYVAFSQNGRLLNPSYYRWANCDFPTQIHTHTFFFCSARDAAEYSRVFTLEKEVSIFQLM